MSKSKNGPVLRGIALELMDIFEADTDHPKFGNNGVNLFQLKIGYQHRVKAGSATIENLVRHLGGMQIVEERIRACQEADIPLTDEEKDALIQAKYGGFYREVLRLRRILESDQENSQWESQDGKGPCKMWGPRALPTGEYFSKNLDTGQLVFGYHPTDRVLGILPKSAHEARERYGYDKPEILWLLAEQVFYVIYSLCSRSRYLIPTPKVAEALLGDWKHYLLGPKRALTENKIRDVFLPMSEHRQLMPST